MISRLHLFIAVGMAYLLINMVTNAVYCYSNFCPGDNENDYVYTVTDEDGKTWYRDDGKFMTEDEYKRSHANIIEFVEKDNDGTKK